MADLYKSQAAALSLMPMTFHSLVVENTSVCNAKCAMCYQSAGPKGSDTWGRSSLPVAELERVLREAATVETLGRRFHLAGGEAFVRPNDCITLFSAARDAGYVDVSTTTNAYWGRVRDKAFGMCSRLREAGLTRMEISWDFWHQPYVSGDTVSNVLEACAEYGISTALRVLTTKSHSVAEALSAIRKSSLDCASEIFTCPVFPIGRAAVEIDRDDIYFTGDITGSCHSTLNLTVNAWGNVYPCCAGADQTDWLSFGNVRERAIDEIAADMNRSLLLRTLVFRGPRAFIPILEQAGFDVGRDYSNICHLCFSVFSVEEYARAIKAFFEEIETEAITNVVRSVSNGGSPVHV